MANNTDSSPSTLWNRRSNTNSKLNLSTKSDSRETHDHPSARRFNSSSGSIKNNPFSPGSVASPTSTGSSAFGLGGGAFSFGSAKTPKTPGATFDIGKAGSASSKAPVEELPLKDTWVVYYRPPTSKNSDYEKSIQPLCKIHTVQAFWKVYTHLQRPSKLPTVSDYHLFKAGIRPVWEDDSNKKGGKWTMRLKKGVADRYWEELFMALIGDQFMEAGEEVCGAVVSVRSGEDVISVWTKNDGGRNVKIRETIKRVLSLPPDTNLQWRSHDESIVQRDQVDKARQEKRRNTMQAEKKEDDDNKS
ncbi:uncharacterized protein MYCFIDRAFT_78904 [Pseudocercospora fijiensis CIRAD86]|uniref:Translation initiation factor eIF4E3 n=1 Tax=Pseudocercospora fijiensis (strain CIRAD86) TaxID=383855 RepID=M3AAL7_PSEFD|nr:uncharacterized protein MYCFIDRAFT_78904 [Pseudocercospora fijiensis CIRAD86]EME81636.1 hypothetical protein MYCFIDRAFT_78904 [Pseudocercospora fijiensis CIRAD86]